MVHRSALITGATSGIGRAFAEALPEATDLVLTGRNEVRLKTLGDFLSREGRRVETVVADLATETGRERVIAAAQTAEIELLKTK